eukprot:CAMPEP_0195511164 /NCGR_PEP_ID=MMETSP0794_2-20130614/3584_1 /TAXON_ID=515487 /ORGANISM="Stephanopyxis turris, Strain CCMP 815" /LENGTH=104 /DNA_ID=CAMNT_0040638713 /DNA_START=180 /DNA_END=495 /DNA_ORIENTATION=-
MRQCNMGMSNTPPLHALKNKNCKSYEVGYDSNWCPGSFYDCFMSKNDIKVDEEDLFEATPDVASMALGENPTIWGKFESCLSQNISEEEMKKLKVPELKDELGF